MDCSICNRPVILRPSAAWRARHYGGTPQGYTALFPTHADCLIKKRSADAIETLRRLDVRESINTLHEGKKSVALEVRV